jgi:nucleotide-binding universal stress UspA family protein
MGLAKLADRLGASRLAIRTRLLHGSVAGALLDCEAKEQPDLVVAATHGRGGLARFALGSVTDRLVKQGRCPVLLTRRAGGEATPLERALVLLDGSSVAEEALPIVEALAGKPVQAVRLFRVVRNAENRDAAQAYLGSVAERLSGSGMTLMPAVEVGEPRYAIERAAQDVDLIILCTHGRTGFDRLRHGSIADYVVHEVNKPALLIRAGMPAANPSA